MIDVLYNEVSIVYNIEMMMMKLMMISTKKVETFSTYGSRVVPHLSTRQAQRCLASEFGWDLAFPPWFDRMSDFKQSMR